MSQPVVTCMACLTLSLAESPEGFFMHGFAAAWSIAGGCPPEEAHDRVRKKFCEPHYHIIMAMNEQLCEARKARATGAN